MIPHLVKVCLLLLAFLLVPPTTTPSRAASEGGHGSESKKSEKKDAGKKETGKAVNGVIDIGPLVANIYSNKGYKFLRIGMTVECVNDAAAERLVMPDAKEDLVFFLSTRQAEDLLSSAGKMILRRDLLDLFNKLSGGGKVKNLYFTEFVFQ